MWNGGRPTFTCQARSHIRYPSICSSALKPLAVSLAQGSDRQLTGIIAGKETLLAAVSAMASRCARRFRDADCSTTQGSGTHPHAVRIC
jgi:hypothetical protein